MKRLLTLLLLIISVNVFGQLQPAPSGTLVPLSTNQAYFRASDSTYYFYNGTNYLWNYFLNKQQADKLYQPLGSPVATPFSLSTGYGLSGSSFNGSVARIFTSDTTSASGLVSKGRLATNLTGYVPKTTTLTINGSTRDLSTNRVWNVGTVLSVGATAGTGISIAGTSPITSSGTYTITNTAPDQTVVLNAGTGISTSGTYPNFTITNTAPSPTLGTSAISLGGTANGLSYLSGNYRLHRVTSSTGGVFTASTDTIGGLKNFYDNINLGKIGTSGKVSFRRSSDGAIASTIEQVNDNKLTLTSAGGTRLFDISADTVMISALTNGLVKSTSGKLSNAVAGTDYLTPTGSGSGLSGVVLTTTNQSIAGVKTFTDQIVPTTTSASSAIAASSTNSGGRVITALGNSTLEPLSVTQQGSGHLAQFNLNATDQVILRNNGSIYTRGQLEVGNLLDGAATDSVMVHRAIDLTVRKVPTTGTGSAVFSASPTFTGTVVGASAGFTTGVNLATSSGSVGVGTATPDYIFDVENSVSNNYVARINNTNTTAGTSFGLLINGGTNSSDNALVINNSANSITLFSHSGAGDLTIYGSNATKASGTAWINPSDLRLKTNIGEYSKGLKEVLAIKPKTWYFNEASGLDKTQKHLSPIAQELQQIMPEMVSTYKGKLNGKEQELLQVDASDMTWLLVKAIQEQQAIIEKLNQRITALEKNP